MHEIYCDWSPIVHWKSLISATRLRPQINLWIAIEVKEITSISVDVITISWNSLRSYATPMTRSASPDGLSTRAYEASFLIGQCKLSGPFEVVNGIREDPNLIFLHWQSPVLGHTKFADPHSTLRAHKHKVVPTYVSYPKPILKYFPNFRVLKSSPNSQFHLRIPRNPNSPSFPNSSQINLGKVTSSDSSFPF